MSAVGIKVLTAYLRAHGIVRTCAPPDWIPDMQPFAIDLARSVSFIPSRRQPLPSTQTLWQGLSRLMIGTACYLVSDRGQRHLSGWLPSGAHFAGV